MPKKMVCAGGLLNGQSVSPHRDKNATHFATDKFKGFVHFYRKARKYFRYVGAYRNLKIGMRRNKLNQKFGCRVVI